MPAKIPIRLSEEQLSFLQVYIHRGQIKTRLFKRAYILLKAAEGWTATEMCDAFACTPTPAGHDHWTLRLLADKVVVLGYVPSISPEAYM
jgi:hypothetical protein